MTIAIRLENLSKRYRIIAPQERNRTLQEALISALKAPARNLRYRLGRFAVDDDSPDAIWALRDISFEVEQGRVVGIIGPNGAGKSTLLKILARITAPTTGQAVLRGRLGSLLEVGTGFHGELSGRENIYLNGAILGMGRAEIARKLDQIIAFAEVEAFVDTPVKHYSSGMYLRLAFAVAAHLETEILLVDEVLAVGDASFQQRCLGKIGEVAQAGRTIFFVSHNMAALTRLCDEAVLLRNGRLVARGAPQDMAAEHLRSSFMGDQATLGETLERPPNSRFWLERIVLRDGNGTPATIGITGQDLEIVLHYDADYDEDLRDAVAILFFFDALGIPLFVCSSRLSRTEDFHLPKRGAISCRIPRLPLMPGSYRLGFTFKARRQQLLQIEDLMTFQVSEGDYFGTGRLPRRTTGPLLVTHRWERTEA